MGLTFYYEGKLRDPQRIDELKKEVQEICISMKWPYQLWPMKHLKKSDESKEGHHDLYDLKGISLTPENCEPLFLTFLPDGRLISPVFFMFSKGKKPEQSDFHLFTKTQYAGVQTHLALMKLLIHLKEKYFEELNVIDEGKYWETKDENILQNQFGLYGEALDKLAEVLLTIDSTPGESGKSIADKIEKGLKK